MKGERVPLWERWVSVLACGLFGAALVGLVVGFVAYLVAFLVADRGFIAPPPWWYFVVGTACGMAALSFGAMGWDDPLWGPTFHSREHGY